MGVGDHEHAKHVTFRALGLSDHDSDTYQPNVDGYVNDIVTWKVRTLKSIRKMLGHENVSVMNVAQCTCVANVCVYSESCSLCEVSCVCLSNTYV